MKKILSIDGLDIIVKYRRGMKNIYLRVEKNGEIVVTAPPRTPNYIIKKLVHDNVNELRRRLNNISTTSISRREFKTGEKFFIFGEELPIEVVNSKQNNVIITTEKIFLLIKNEDENREKIFKKAIRTKLYNKSMEFIKKYEPLMKVEAKELRIKKMKTRWGTCNIEARRIWINEELIKYPISCLEHIVVHELTHLLETNHTKRFYDLLEKFYPDYKRNDQLLKYFNKYLNGR